jgi:TIR domain
MTTVFISYAHADEDFARQIDASLLASGLVTFFAPRDVAVGESIPSRIFDEIARASNLAVILSAASINSRWVADELSAARMRQLSDANIKILPILIDDICPPSSVGHLRYADFRGWKDMNVYRKAVSDLLIGIGVTRKTLGREDLVWYGRNARLLAELRYEALVAAGMIEGVLLLHLYQENAHAPTVRTIWRDMRIVDQLQGVIDASDAIASTRVRALADVARTFDIPAFQEARRSHDAGRRFYHQLHVIAKMIDELQFEFELAIGVAFDFGVATPADA